MYKHFYTCVNLVYANIYACIQYILGISQVYTDMCTMHIYTKYMSGLFFIWPGLFSCYVIWRYEPYVHFHVAVTYLYTHTLLQSIFSPSSAHDSIFEYMGLASGGKLVFQVVRIPVACVKYRHTPSICLQFDQYTRYMPEYTTTLL